MYTTARTVSVPFRLLLAICAIAIIASSCGDDEVTGPVTAVPGDWSGTAEFGTLGFLVSFGSPQTIASINFDFQDWRCGNATRQGPDTSNAPGPLVGWPISSSGAFTIETSHDSLDMTVVGTFSANSAASGAWTGVLVGTTCSGMWQANFLDF